MLLLPLFALGFLWFTLINHLRVEWSINPQYAYGWAVPVLCLYLIWRRVNGVQQCERPGGSTDGPTVPRAPLPSARFYLLCSLVAFLYLPTRLVQEANPDWQIEE